MTRVILPADVVKQQRGDLTAAAKVRASYSDGSTLCSFWSVALCDFPDCSISVRYVGVVLCAELDSRLSGRQG